MRSARAERFKAQGSGALFVFRGFAVLLWLHTKGYWNRYISAYLSGFDQLGYAEIDCSRILFRIRISNGRISKNEGWRLRRANRTPPPPTGTGRQSACSRTISPTMYRRATGGRMSGNGSPATYAATNAVFQTSPTSRREEILEQDGLVRFLPFPLCISWPEPIYSFLVCLL